MYAIPILVSHRVRLLLPHYDGVLAFPCNPRASKHIVSFNNCEVFMSS
uniref:Uncharacterized protein n=1 Tax=Anguilla anguilla TaxID=7936 RepID=A0A0E9VZX2_ANGAN